MKHYLLTRSAYAPTVSPERNRVRLELLRRVTVPSIAAQTAVSDQPRDIRWLVLIDPDDPLLAERTAAFEAGGLRLILAPGKGIERSHAHDRPKGPWAKYIDWSGPVMTTRLDDDDAFAPWVLARFHENGLSREERNPTRRIGWNLPVGWRVSGKKAAKRNDPVSQFSCLYAPLGDHATIMDINHTSIRGLVNIRPASMEPGWLWVRHPETRSVRTRAPDYQGETMRAITKATRAAFPVDWDLIESLG